jgi:hypothetical protein
MHPSITKEMLSDSYFYSDFVYVERSTTGYYKPKVYFNGDYNNPRSFLDIDWNVENGFEGCSLNSVYLDNKILGGFAGVFNNLLAKKFIK